MRLFSVYCISNSTQNVLRITRYGAFVVAYVIGISEGAVSYPDALFLSYAIQQVSGNTCSPIDHFRSPHVSSPINLSVGLGAFFRWARRFDWAGSTTGCNPLQACRRLVVCSGGRPGERAVPSDRGRRDFLLWVRGGTRGTSKAPSSRIPRFLAGE